MATTAQAAGDPAGTSAAEQAWFLLQSLLGQQRRRFLIAASELELHPAQAGTLLHMQPGEPRPMHELAALLACDNSNVTGIIDRLEARGLVERQPFEQDRRVKHITLTSSGDELRRALVSRLGQPPAGLDRLSDAEQRELRDLLCRIVEG
jgi:DNA-binding MarR family transcriptional regulator